MNGKVELLTAGTPAVVAPLYGVDFLICHSQGVMLAGGLNQFTWFLIDCLPVLLGVVEVCAWKPSAGPHLRPLLDVYLDKHDTRGH